MKNIKLKRLSLLALFTVGSIFMVGCGKKDAFTDPAADTNVEVVTHETKDLPSSSIEVFAMDTYMTLTAYGDHAEEALKAAEKEIKRIEDLLSVGISTSEIAMINHDGKGSISEDTAFLLSKSKEIYESTGGVFDITIYPVMEAWGFTSQNYRVPEDSELIELKAFMGPENIVLSEDHKEVSLMTEGMQIDLGGIAKGYTSNRVIEILKGYGIEHAVISLGGNVQLLGDKPGGKKWKIGVQDPQNPDGYIGVLEEEDVAIITSGGYERFFEEDGQTYHHIIDPETLYPARSGLTSVTIVSKDGTLADALSTSLFIMGEEKAISYYKDHKDEFDMILVREDESVLISEGLADCFSAEGSFEIINAQ